MMLLPGVMGWWPERSVTFLENHDTGSSQMHWPFPDRGLHQVLVVVAWGNCTSPLAIASGS